jgi:hypothetical protein
LTRQAAYGRFRRHPLDMLKTMHNGWQATCHTIWRWSVRVNGHQPWSREGGAEPGPVPRSSWWCCSATLCNKKDPNSKQSIEPVTRNSPQHCSSTAVNCHAPAFLSMLNTSPPESSRCDNRSLIKELLPREGCYTEIDSRGMRAVTEWSQASARSCS